MLRIVIAEDEIGIFNLIKALIDFNRLDLQLVGSAYNGQQALDLITQLQPDIVITDISMPFMTGLELIQETKKRNIHTKFIIISGYAQFDYARSALKMGVEDYLLKPINRQELNDVLEKSVLKITSTADENYLTQRSVIDTNLQKYKSRRSFIMNLVYNNAVSNELDIQKINEKYLFSFENNAVFILGIVQIDDLDSLNFIVQNMVLEQMMHIFQEEIESKCYDFELYEKNNQFIFLINFDSKTKLIIKETLTYILKRFIDFLNSYDKLSVTISCGSPCKNHLSLGSSLKSAYQVLTARILSGHGRIYYANEYCFDLIPVNDSTIRKYMNDLRSYIEVNNLEHVKKTLYHIFMRIIGLSSKQPHFLIDHFKENVFVILSELYQHKMIQDDITAYYRRINDALELISTKEKLLETAVKLIYEILPIASSSGEENATKIIQIAKHYIEDNYNKNIKLEDVAEQVYLTPSYFGIFFKKEFGETFSYYIINLRINKAKELLKDLKYNVSEIANEVGYQDPRHFSKLFKEHVGVTPKEYRKIHYNRSY